MGIIGLARQRYLFKYVFPERVVQRNYIIAIIAW